MSFRGFRMVQITYGGALLVFTMKKIGLLTLPLKDNYGGILQALALYTYLTRLGCEVTLIQKENFHSMWMKLLIFFFERTPFQNLKKLRSTHLNSKKHRTLIDSIIAKKTPRAFTRSEMARIAIEYKFDSIVVGSDQVWRMQYIDKVYYGTYFLDFLNAESTRKVAYAASFGLDHWPMLDKSQEISRLLVGFDALSSRESSGVELCKEFGRSDCEHVLDPTLLIEKDFYEQLVDGLPPPSRKSFLCYLLDESTFNDSIIYQCTSILGEEHHREHIYEKGSSRQEYSISEWIKAFHRADFIVTDSFHGMVFSIIFNKQFVAISNSTRGSSRFESLLKELGIISRLISSNADFDISALVNQKIDYDSVNSRLATWRKRSEKFLRDAVLV